MHYAKMVELIEASRGVGQSEATSWVKDQLFDTFSAWLATQVPDPTKLHEVELGVLFDAFRDGFDKR